MIIQPKLTIRYTLTHFKFRIPKVCSLTIAILIRLVVGALLLIRFVLRDALQANIAPRFEFGFGLSYTTFAYSDLSITGSAAGGNPRSGYGASVDANLHEKVITVSFTVQNNGAVAGHEVCIDCFDVFFRVVIYKRRSSDSSAVSVSPCISQLPAIAIEGFRLCALATWPIPRY